MRGRSSVLQPAAVVRHLDEDALRIDLHPGRDPDLAARLARARCAPATCRHGVRRSPPRRSGSGSRSRPRAAPYRRRRAAADRPHPASDRCPPSCSCGLAHRDRVANDAVDLLPAARGGVAPGERQQVADDAGGAIGVVADRAQLLGLERRRLASPASARRSRARPAADCSTRARRPTPAGRPPRASRAAPAAAASLARSCPARINARRDRNSRATTTMPNGIIQRQRHARPQRLDVAATRRAAAARPRRSSGIAISSADRDQRHHRQLATAPAPRPPARTTSASYAVAAASSITAYGAM